MSLGIKCIKYVSLLREDIRCKGQIKCVETILRGSGKGARGCGYGEKKLGRSDCTRRESGAGELWQKADFNGFIASLVYLSIVHVNVSEQTY